MPRRNSNVERPVVFDKGLGTYITLEGRRLPVIETGGWSNKHWNVRRRAVICPTCGKDKTGCAEARKLGVDLCIDFRCDAAKAVRRVLRAERDDGSTKRYGERKANARSQGGSRVATLKPKPAPQPKPKVDPMLRVAAEGAEGDSALAQAFRRAAKEAA